MGIEYNLTEVEESQKLNELRLELSPRNQCRDYVLETNGRAELLEKEEFDSSYRKKMFVEGPFRDSFGDGYGEPYNPNRQAFGRLKNGKVVYCELSKANQEKVRCLLEQIAVH
jgi:hypothetical protein